MKSKKQAVLDGGSWETAWLMTGLPDRLARSSYVGTMQEMSTLAAYKKTLKEARGSASGPAPQVSDEEGEKEDEVQEVDGFF